MNRPPVPLAPPSTTRLAVRARVLVVDDDVGVAQVFGELFSLNGYAVTVCYSARRALACLAASRFDVVLSDYHMPVMNGAEFYRLATRLDPGLAQRFVFFTGDSFQDETLDFLHSTGKPFLIKPLDFAAVERLVVQVVRENGATAPRAERVAAAAPCA